MTALLLLQREPPGQYAHEVTRRKDAVRNREALVVAAAQVFSRLGTEAPLDYVAREAGLGRGTLYRHFPDRGTLLAALVERRLELLGEFAAEHRDELDLLERLIVEICGFLQALPGLLAVASRFDSMRAQLEEAVDRSGTILRQALRAGQDEGMIRPDVTLQDVFVVLSMVDGAILRKFDSVVPDSVDRSLALGLRALRTPAAFDRPVPARTLEFPTADVAASPHRVGDDAPAPATSPPAAPGPTLP